MSDAIPVKVSLAWWVRPYIHLLSVVALLTGRMPDLERVKRICQRGVRTKVGK